MTVFALWPQEEPEENHKLQAAPLHPAPVQRRDEGCTQAETARKTTKATETKRGNIVSTLKPIRVATVLMLLVTAAVAQSGDQSPVWGPVCRGDGKDSAGCILPLTRYIYT